MRDRGSHKTKRASYIEESWAIVYRNGLIRSQSLGVDELGALTQMRAQWVKKSCSACLHTIAVYSFCCGRPPLGPAPEALRMREPS